MENLVNIVVDQLIENKVISTEDREIYSFGLQEGILLILNIILTFVIFNLFSDMRTGLLFLLCFVPVRCYAGGFHAKTRIQCFIYSFFLICIAAIGIELIQGVTYVLQIMLCIISIIILKISPLENPNKKLYEYETKVYKQKVTIVVCSEVAIAFIFGHVFPKILKIMFISQSLVLLLLLVALFEKKGKYFSENKK